MKNKAIPEEYLEMLTAKRAAIVAALGEPAHEAAPGRLAEEDQVNYLHDEFVSLRMKSLDYETLRKVDAALARIKEGRFGVCASCERAIPRKRLAAIPWAEYCVACQDQIAAAAATADDERAA
jgi:RNA polymerase-binding transcription factor DksA